MVERPSRDALRAAWIERLHSYGSKSVDPFMVGGMVLDDLLEDEGPLSPSQWRRRVADLMELVDRAGHERGEPLGDSIHDMWFMRKVPAEQIAERLGSGRFWREWPEE